MRGLSANAWVELLPVFVVVFRMFRQVEVRHIHVLQPDRCYGLEAIKDSIEVNMTFDREF